MDCSRAKCYSHERDSYPCHQGHIPHTLTNWTNSQPNFQEDALRIADGSLLNILLPLDIDALASLFVLRLGTLRSGPSPICVCLLSRSLYCGSFFLLYINNNKWMFRRWARVSRPASTCVSHALSIFPLNTVLSVQFWTFFKLILLLFCFQAINYVVIDLVKGGQNGGLV